jgi:hypothetical protein
MFCRGEHRFTRGWVLGSWICPVVNLWYPKQVVDDIVAASDPRTPPQTQSLKTIPGTQLVWAWWLTWVAGLVTGNVVQRGVLGGATEVGQLRTILIQRIDELQTRRPWVPWWAAGQQQTGFQPPAR